MFWKMCNCVPFGSRVLLYFCNHNRFIYILAYKFIVKLLKLIKKAMRKF